MKLIRHIIWALNRQKIEQNIREYVDLEYRRGDKFTAYEQICAEHKTRFIEGV